MPKIVVFLSSVFYGMTKLREEIADLLTAQGYDVLRLEYFPKPESYTMARALCLAGIEASDVYLGVLPGRYGSDPLGLAFTEMEYLHATHLGHPRYVYCLRDRRFTTVDQREKQKGFLLLVKDRDLNVNIFRPKNVSTLAELKKQVSLDFRELCNNWPLPKQNLDQARCIVNIQNTLGRTKRQLFHIDLNPSEGAELLREVSMISFDDALTLGLALFDHYFSNSDWTRRKSLYEMDEFLRVWAEVAVLKGLRGTLGKPHITKARIVLNQMAERYVLIPKLAAHVASGFYAENRLNQAQKWLALAHRDGPTSWIDGPIALACGQLAEAEAAFLSDLRRTGQSPNFLALRWAYYGLCQVRQGNNREGMRHIIQSVSSKDLAPTTNIRIKRALAEAYLHKHALDESLVTCESAEKIARFHGVDDQVRKIRHLRWRINSAKAKTSQ